MTKENIKISLKEVGQRIEVLCHKKFPQFSRTKWQTSGKFFCEGIKKTGKTKVKEGETWTITLPSKTTTISDLSPWEHPLHIIKESKNWLAIEKPIDISVHPSASEKTNHTITNALIAHLGKNLSNIENEKCPRPGIVHRLDKTTSGILLVAKSDPTHRYLQKNWPQVEKEYYAIVQGNPPQKGKIEGGILRDQKDRKKMAVSKEEKAKEAITYFQVEESNKDHTLLKVKIPTGRTHQIRVHLSAIGSPILGDEKDGGKKAERIFLHATSLKFPDPDKNGDVTKIKSPLPESFKKIIQNA